MSCVLGVGIISLAFYCLVEVEVLRSSTVLGNNCIEFMSLGEVGRGKVVLLGICPRGS